jgi:hypothetical protein
MEAYKTMCSHCGHKRYWVGYKTGIGKTPEQLELMIREQKTCERCGAGDATTDVDRESPVGLDFAEGDGMLISAIQSSFRPKTLPMLEILHRVEEDMPRLLVDESEWQGLRIDYEKPVVERLWRQISGFRISLHRIHPCGEDEALFHPHPWPSAMRIVDGSYRMPWGYGAGEIAPLVSNITVYSTGSEYAMTDRDEWHSVQPLDRPSLSLMITGPPWQRWSPRSTGSLQNLEQRSKIESLEFFRSVYK